MAMTYEEIEALMNEEYIEPVNSATEELDDELDDVLSGIAGIDGSTEDNDDISREPKNIFEAIEQNDIDKVKSYIEDINTQEWENDNNTPLHKALQNDNIDIAKILIESGADISIENYSYISSFCLMLEKEYIDLMKLSILNSTDANQKHIIFNVVASEQIDLLEFLIQNEADINIQDRRNNTPLHIALQNDNIDIAKILIENDADVSIENYDNISPFCLMLEKKYLDLVKLSILNGTDANLKCQGEPIILDAIVSGQIDFLEFIIQNGADINVKDEYGFMPLDAYYLLDNNSVIKDILINKGAITGITDKNRSLYLGAAICFKNDKIIKQLVDDGVDINSAKFEDDELLLHYAVINSEIKILKSIIEYGIDVNTKNDEGLTPLNIALDNKNNEIVELLIKNGANINEKNKSGYTPLHLAICKHLDNTVKLLIDNGAKIDEITNNKITSLHLATQISSLDIVKNLIKNGVDINALNNYNETPLHIAVIEDDINIVKFLYENDANIDIENSLNLSPKDIINIECKTNLKKILEIQEQTIENYMSIYPYSFTEIDFITSNCNYAEIFEVFIDISTDIKKNGFRELKKKSGILYMFLYKLYESYYDLKIISDDTQSSLKSYIKTIIKASRFRDIVYGFINLIANDESIGNFKMICNAMLVEGEYEDKSPLQWFDDQDSYLSELAIAKEKFWPEIQSNGVMSIESKVYSLNNILIREFLNLLIDNCRFETIRYMFDVKKTHAIWYIKDNCKKQQKEKLEQFENDWKQLEELMDFYHETKWFKD